MSTTELPITATSRRTTELVAFALESLPAMRLDDGVFCFERRIGEARPIGTSPRYTLMVELGLLRAQAAGYELPFDVDEINTVAWRLLEQDALTPGDIGLMLWIDARRGGRRGADLAVRLDGALASGGGLPARLGMELGWIVTGLAHHVATNPSATGTWLLKESLDQLLTRNRAPSNLFRHFGAAGWRRRFPNFATQIYSVLALAVVARYGLDERALPAACATADLLLDAQLGDGGWPWLYDSERGTVVERYEVYSVHQDAMAPMALLELADASGDERYVGAVARGLNWIYGDNDLGANMIDDENGLVLRSIRRRRRFDRFWGGTKAAASRAGLPVGGSPGRMIETNPTDRPYHFGWVLEAWCGREDAFAGNE